MLQFEENTKWYIDQWKLTRVQNVKVYSFPDNILRKKIHLELEDFQATLHEVLDGHMEHINHLFNLSLPTDTEVSINLSYL